LTCSAAPRLRILRRPSTWSGFALLASLALLALACASGGSTPGVGQSLADLTNPSLGPDYAQWLVGPISFLATTEEVPAYLALQDDEAAEAFIVRFWDRRNPGHKEQNALRDLFEKRGAEADRLYSEAGFEGRRTDRGTIHVIYGAPKKIEFDAPRGPREAPVEVWTYGPDAKTGLNDRKPSPRYRFMKRGDLTVFYLSGRSDPVRRGIPRGEEP
jgi:GWxTD domain-containing protein